MSNRPYRIYWDTCCLISYLAKVTDRIGDLQGIVDEVQKSKGNRIIITSAVTKVELVYVATDGRAPDADSEEKIDALWRSDKLIQVVELHPFISDIAVKMIRRGKREGFKKLHTFDAIQLATAKFAEANEFHSYNAKDFEGYDSDLAFKVTAPVCQQGTIVYSDPEQST